jgi:FtsP/CotA-like multicopper oxidase with cupredoxin domain
MTGREGEQLLVNGQVRPRLTATPGDRERWRIVNACVSRYLQLRLDGQDLHLLGIDLPLGGQPQPTSEVLLAPGNRADLLVTTRAGTSTLQALPYDRGAGTAMGMGMGGTARTANAPSTVDLATLTVDGNAAAPVRTALPQPAAKDLRGSPVTTRRSLTLAIGMSMKADGMAFTIDGHPFDPTRTDQAVQAGAVEEWTITNTSAMDHPFHLHVWPMQVLSVGGAVTDSPTWQNVVNVPANSNSVIRIAFKKDTGRTVYHCHILDHEDNGMMGVVQVGAA